MRIELGEVGLYDPDAGVGRLDGHVIVVGDAAKMVGKKVKVRIERVLDGVAYASLLTTPGKETTLIVPVTAELEAVKPTRQPPRRKPAEPKSAEPKAAAPKSAEPKPKPAEPKPKAAAPKPAGTKPTEPKAEKPATEKKVEAKAEVGEAEAAEKPKRRTRRGSRGGRGRRKPATAAATAEATAEADGGANGQVEARIHVPEPDLGQEEPEAVAEAEPSDPSQNGAEPEKAPTPRRRTRRGSRGGRNRRKKPAAATEKATGQLEFQRRGRHARVPT